MTGPAGPGLDAVLATLEEARGVRFGDYRAELVERRVAARMAAVGAPSYGAYRDVLARDPGELDRLLGDLAIGVTSFFRDPAVFAAIEREVLARLPRPPPADAPLRAWVVGCASGEEAWSLAMLLASSAGPGSASPGARGFEVLATDIDPRALARAEAGRYPAEAAAEVPEALRGRFLEPAGGGEVRVAAALRPSVVFARHDFVGTRLAPREAVLASFDLVLCRNVLIYFTDSLRRRAVDRLAAVIRPGGALVLGAAEALPPAARGAFEEVAAGARIYLRRAGEASP